MSHLDYRSLLVVDIETTGVNPFRHDALAVGLVPVDPNLPHKQVFIKHEQLEWNAFALANFERFRGVWADRAVYPVDACEAIETYVRDNFGGREVTLIGHNIGFDVAFLRKIAYQAGRDQLSGISHRMIDTHTLLYVLSAIGRIPSTATSSDGALKHFGVQFAPERRHTALEDARATRDLFLATVRQLADI